MHEQGKVKSIMFFTLLVFLFTFCNKTDDEPVNTNDPSNLTVEILSIDHNTGEVKIRASASNTVQYQMYIGDSESPEESNETGYFEYNFGEPGNYSFSIRAYGSSGRYIKADRSLTIAPESDPIPLSRGYFTPLEYNGYSRVWQDEFNGSSINSDYWSYDNGDGCPNNCGWGNNELEYYRSENAWVADSVLTIEARMETYAGYSYTSAKLKTFGKKSFQYGRIDIRALLPKGQGMWPALWMLGNDINSVGWPKCGEIDIMEMIGGSNRENTVHGTLHWDNAGEYASYGQSSTVPSGEYTFAEAYHVFSIIWDENTIRWFVDDVQYNIIDISGASMSEFHQPHWLIFNVAVGGNWPGSPDASTLFPQQMKVDYIRVFQVQ